MALVKEIKEAKMERNSIHKEVECTYTKFKDSKGQLYLQLDTYGSEFRKLAGKKSQSLQFDKVSLLALKKIIDTLL
jgi:hypothetical protein